ncbi:MAG: hypothetical protein ACT4OF_05470 [Caulobacteraceae bacterium]
MAELRAMARKGGANAPKLHGTVSGRLVNERGPGADPVLANREGVADARDVRRSDYWASNALGNLSAIIGVAGGVAIGFSAQGVIGFMFVIWGLTAVATGRMMKSNKSSERVFMGRAARLAGAGAMLTGAWFIYQGWSEPAVLSYFVPEYEAPMGGLFGKR